MKGRLLLDVVVRESTPVFKLLAGKDQPLLVWGDSFLVLDLGLHIFDRVASFHFEGDGLSSERLHEDLHATTEAKNKVKGRLLLDVVVGESTSVFELLAGENESLLVWGDALLVLDLGLDVLDSIGGLDLKSDGLSSERLHKDLHATTETKNKMKGRLLLDVVVRESTPVFKLLAGKDQPLLVWGDSFLVLDLGLHIFDRVASFHFEGDGLSSERLHEDLHTTTEAKNKMKGRLLLDVVVGESTSVFELLASENESLLVWWDTLLVLDLGLDVLDSIGGLDLEGDGLSSERLHENLHLWYNESSFLSRKEEKFEHE